jgi:hypothetical protein
MPAASARRWASNLGRKSCANGHFLPIAGRFAYLHAGLGYMPDWASFRSGARVLE